MGTGAFHALRTPVTKAVLTKAWPKSRGRRWAGHCRGNPEASWAPAGLFLLCSLPQLFRWEVRVGTGPPQPSPLSTLQETPPPQRSDPTARTPTAVPGKLAAARAPAC
ncbi:unnamed protein product [Staurois parvus]|uniref:Uncharacterized protein n=1 Tax=Staurois parvus TaxID=386267 RepID=A0ABN9G4B4_9NEOB|nr:unnamed protein product [Staurois parvus]